MTVIYSCELELQDSMYYATREIGRLYETEPVIHNYALCYALGLVDSEKYATQVAEEHSYRYFCGEQVPKYQEHLTPLNERSIYITPATAIRHTSTLNTWKYANNNYHVEMEKTQKNIPSYGRAKEVAPESVFEFFLISPAEIQLPRWIRLGKWMSKAELSYHPIASYIEKNGEFICDRCLNPLDVMFANRVLSYDVVNMPPVSLIKNVQMSGKYFQFTSINGGEIKIPVNMKYHFG